MHVSNPLTKIRKNPNFIITGENASGPFEIKVGSFMELTRCPELAIVTGRVLSGTVNTGDPIKIQFHGGNPIDEKIKSIQIQKIDIPSAATGKGIGIKLSSTTFQKLLTLNNGSNN